MAVPSYALLEDRGLIAVEGEDARGFLQGLVSNDVDKVDAERAVHAAFLTPQGKYLHDFFMIQMGEALVVDCEAGRADDLVRRLGVYKLRARVTLSERTGEFAVAAVFGEGAFKSLGLAARVGHAAPFAGGLAYVDPRLAAAGARAVLPRPGAAQALEKAGFEAATAAEYDTLRLRLGLPDGSRDMVVEKATLLESGFDELNGVDWDKGCYMGQELTARTKYRGLTKKRLMPVDIDGPVPAPGTPVMVNGKEAGEMRSARGGVGLALIRLEHLDKAGGALFTAGEARITPRKPDWAAF